MIVHDWTKRLRSINDILRYAIRNGKNSIHIKSFPLIYSFNIKVKLFQRVMKKDCATISELYKILILKWRLCVLILYVKGTKRSTKKTLTIRSTYFEIPGSVPRLLLRTSVQVFLSSVHQVNAYYIYSFRAPKTIPFSALFTVFLFSRRFASYYWKWTL